MYGCRGGGGSIEKILSTCAALESLEMAHANTNWAWKFDYKLNQPNHFNYWAVLWTFFLTPYRGLACEMFVVHEFLHFLQIRCISSLFSIWWWMEHFIINHISQEGFLLYPLKLLNLWTSIGRDSGRTSQGWMSNNLFLLRLKTVKLANFT